MRAPVGLDIVREHSGEIRRTAKELRMRENEKQGEGEGELGHPKP